MSYAKFQVYAILIMGGLCFVFAWLQKADRKRRDSRN